MNTINQVDVLTALNNLMGRRVLPGGEQDDLKRYCQMAFDYAWRYYKWSFSLAQADLVADGDGIVWMPEDFDYEGWHSAAGLTELSLADLANTTGSTSYALIYDFDENRYKTSPATAMSLTYQVTPPTLGTDDAGAVPFPSAMAIAIGASVYAKQGENPTRADISQEWDLFHAELDRLVGRAETNKPRSAVRNFHDRAGTYPGDVGA